MKATEKNMKILCEYAKKEYHSIILIDRLLNYHIQQIKESEAMC